MRTLHRLLCLTAFATISAADTSADTEVMDALQEILSRLDQIEQRLDSIESESVEEVVAAVNETLSEQSGTKGQGSMVDRVVEAVNFQQEAAQFPWMDAAKWEQIEKDMSADEVISILGEPTLDDPSLNKRIDRVLTYRGRRVATNERLTGKIRFRDDEVVEVEAPKL